MKSKPLQVVGIAFIREGKLLISKSKKSAKNNKYTLVGGKIEEGETIIQAAIRECKEELGEEFEIEESQLKPILNFREHAASDYNLIIEMNILLSQKDIDIEIVPHREIIEYRWFELGEDEEILSSSISKHFLLFAKNEGIMYSQKQSIEINQKKAEER